MPLPDRPSVPKRLSSAELENSYFRAWALRGSEATERSQGTSSGSTPSSPVSPFAQVLDRRTRNLDRKRVLSESHLPRPSPPLRGPPPSSEPTYYPPITIDEAPSPLQKRATTTSSSSGKSSLRSSIGSKARKVLGFPNVQLSSSETKDGPPPQKAQEGFRWKRATSGYWLEVKIVRKKSAVTSRATSLEANPLGRARTAEQPTYYDATNSILTNDRPSPTRSAPLEGSDSKSQTSDSPTAKSSLADPLISPKFLKEGLYCRTKRALGLKNDPAIVDGGNTPITGGATSEVTSLLDRTSSTLRYLASKGREPTNSSATPSNLSIASPSSASRWQHLRPSLSGGSTKSSSSSIRFLKRGKPPPPTPDPQSMYTGSDRNQYFAVELTDPDAPKFLPSEARKIPTPSSGTPGELGTSKLRAFFLEYDPSRDTWGTYSPNSKMTTPPTPGGQTRETEWYRVETPTSNICAGLSREQFTLSVPEHLPSSPMCPKHPKNKSGGKGVCVYHGRNPIEAPQVTSYGRA